MKNIIPSHKGFTLIELSIVLVIIGLLIGGILAGRDLIHIAGAKSIISQITSYNTAVSTFQVKYNALPGDMTNAKSLIAGASQNGDGDGAIGILLNNICGTCPGPATAASAITGYQFQPTTSYEYSSFWQHLALLGLISGNYTVINFNTYMPNVNLPAAQTNNNASILPYNNSGDGVNYYQLGWAVPGTGLSDYPFLSPADAYYIDSKLDDGLPASGTVAARGQWNWRYGLEQPASWSGGSGSGYNLKNSCVIGATYATSTAYNVANTSISSELCELRIKIN